MAAPSAVGRRSSSSSGRFASSAVAKSYVSRANRSARSRSPAARAVRPIQDCAWRLSGVVPLTARSAATRSAAATKSRALPAARTAATRSAGGTVVDTALGVEELADDVGSSDDDRTNQTAKAATATTAPAISLRFIGVIVLLLRDQYGTITDRESFGSAHRSLGTMALQPGRPGS